MLGRARHVVNIVAPGEWRGASNTSTMVTLVNGDDSYYWQGFENRAEIDQVIDALIEARNVAFPE